MTGAVFDSIVEIYHRQLVATGCADARLLDVDIRDLTRDQFDGFRKLTAEAFQDKPLFFKLALTFARDAVGGALAMALRKLDADTLRLNQAADAIVMSAKGTSAESLEANFAWRQIIGSR